MIPMPRTGNWKETHGSWEGFCAAVHHSIGRNLGSGTIQFYTKAMKIDLDNGNYTLLFEEGKLRALRYGEEWRDLVGDNLVLVMGFEIERLRKRLELIEDNLGDDKAVRQWVLAHNDKIDELL